jgi:N-acetylmuramoyl-L-alanine amidase
VRIFFRVFRINQHLMLASLLASLLAGALYPFAVAAGERRAVQAISWSVASKVIVVDPGHGGSDPGTVSSAGVKEKDVNLEIARKLAALFRQAGAVAILTREGDYELTDLDNQSGVSNRDELRARLELAEKHNADLYISIHLNSYPAADCEGAQVFYHPSSAEGHRLATLVQQELINRLGDTYRWVKPEDFVVLRSSKCPAIVVEAGFLSHPREGVQLSQPAYQDKVAWCIYAGVVQFFAGHPPVKGPY